MERLKVAVFILLLAGCIKEHNPKIIITTSEGEIEAELFIDRSPITANNFLKYADAGKYNSGAAFYRVVRMDNQPGKKIKIEVIQGGFMEDSLIEKYQFNPIPHETTSETGIQHTDGVLSMARMEPGSASSEFFICIGDQPELDFGGKRNPDGQGFAAFGKVTAGMEVVKKIQQMKDTSQILVKPIKIYSVSRIK